MSQDPSHRPADEAASDSDIDGARAAFNQRFRKGHHPSTLEDEVLKHRDVIFKRTLYHAIKHEDFVWDDPSNAEEQDFALTCVTDIATIARYDSGGSKVTIGALKRAEQSVIRYWKVKCPFLARSEKEIFCRLYSENGQPLANDDPAARQSE